MHLAGRARATARHRASRRPRLRPRARQSRPRQSPAAWHAFPPGHTNGSARRGRRLRCSDPGSRRGSAPRRSRSARRSDSRETRVVSGGTCPRITASSPPRRSAAGQRLEQLARVRMLRRSEELLARRHLDDLARHTSPPTRCAICATTPRSCVISSIAMPLSRCSPAQQVQHLRLDGDVERRRRLVGDQQIRLGGERHGDHDALLHAAGQLERIFAQAPRGIRDADRLAAAPARACASPRRAGRYAAPAPRRSAARR